MTDEPVTESRDAGNTFVICGTHFNLFIPRVRKTGFQLYEVLGETRSRRKAYRMLADAMETGKYKRGDVLATTREPSWYEPTILVEMKR